MAKKAAKKTAKKAPAKKAPAKKTAAKTPAAPAEAPPGTPGTVAWMELNTTDPSAARSFYTQLLGFKTKTMPMPGLGEYTMLNPGKGRDVAGIARVMDGAPPMWLVYFHVKDVDASAKKCVSLGGKVIMEPTTIPESGGRLAILLDGQGIAFAVYKGTM